jgi:predicted acyl esterase
MAANIIFERDVTIPMDDGVILRADIYRPKESGPHPVIMTLGPYGKGVPYRVGYKPQWEWLISQHPEILPGSSREYNTWETVDPEVWVPFGYVCIRCVL